MVRSEAAGGDHAVDMRMVLQSLVPGREHAEETTVLLPQLPPIADGRYSRERWIGHVFGGLATIIYMPIVGILISRVAVPRTKYLRSDEASKRMRLSSASPLARDSA